MQVLKRNWQALAIALIALGFLAWSALFIYRSSFIAIDGKRYFSLFDDAMVSMRYAWNLAHGHGLVWNPGERVQGYSNLLMTVSMSLSTLVFSKSVAVLSIQVMGIPVVLAIAFLTRSLAKAALPERSGGLRALAGLLSFSSILLYYPLLYWTLMGMETGLLTVLLLSAVLVAFRYSESGSGAVLVAAALLFGLAFLTRNDSVLLIFGAGALLIVERRSSLRRYPLSDLLVAAGAVLIVIVGELIFQYLYYGEALPNTYTLKLTGMSLSQRLRDGLGFLIPFLQESAVLLCLAVAGAILRCTSKKLVLLYGVASAIMYQLYIGGDAWNYWRLLVPAIPMALVLGLDASMSISEGAAGWCQRRFKLPRDSGRLTESFVACGALILVLTALSLADARFWPEISLRAKPYDTASNANNVNTAIALNDVLRPDATIGVIWAGALPYYTDFKAIDFLGKSDRRIAHLPPDLSGSVNWYGMSSVPGHNKYDLGYSIIALRPTFVQALSWHSQDVSVWASTVYAKVHHRGQSLYLLRDSPDVRWEGLAVP